ncbi:hypothetical protein [Candidatus Tisiphia endosymbiont of Dioctria rufipes]
MERLWKLMHRIVTNNKFCHNFAQFSEAIDRFLLILINTKVICLLL